MSKLDYEIGWCRRHNDLAKRYEDGSWGCWWECVVEHQGDHAESDFALRLLIDPEKIDYEAALEACSLIWPYSRITKSDIEFVVNAALLGIWN